MKSQIIIILVTIILLLTSCFTHKKGSLNENRAIITHHTNTTKHDDSESEFLIRQNLEVVNFEKEVIHDTAFVNLKDFSSDFIYDMKYATVDNFLKSKVYECEACYLRYKTVKSLLKANEKFMKKGVRIKIFDCYRPLDIQKKMWIIIPNPEYVANPSKGSIHNRGGAVDITLVDSLGNDLDMGTTFDYFGIEASHNYDNLTDIVKKNRKLLRSVMIQNDFRIFESEWWHYNLKNSRKDNLSNFKWKCD